MTETGEEKRNLFCQASQPFSLIKQCIWEKVPFTNLVFQFKFGELFCFHQEKYRVLLIDVFTIQIDREMDESSEWYL